MNIGLAFKAFFAALLKPESAKHIAAALKQTSGETTVASGETISPTIAGAPKAALEQPGAVIPVASKPKFSSHRSDALTLLAALQRDARLLDLVQEPLGSYSDAQVGAAARDVLLETNKVLRRMFSIQPLCNAGEGDSIDLPAPLNANRWKLTGAAATAVPGAMKVEVLHPGWMATMQNVPTWTGDPDDSLILAATEVQ